MAGDIPPPSKKSKVDDAEYPKDEELEGEKVKVPLKSLSEEHCVLWGGF